MDIYTSIGHKIEAHHWLVALDYYFASVSPRQIFLDGLPHHDLEPSGFDFKALRSVRKRILSLSVSTVDHTDANIIHVRF